MRLANAKHVRGTLWMFQGKSSEWEHTAFLAKGWNIKNGPQRHRSKGTW